MNTFFWIVEYGVTFTELYLCTIFCAAFMPEESLKKNFIKRVAVCLIAACIMCLVNTISLFSPASTAVGLTLAIVTQITIYQKKPVKLAALSFLYMLILLISGTIVGSLISYISNIPTSELYQELSIYRVLLTVCSKVFLLLIVNVIYHLFRKTNGMNTNYMIALSVISIIMFFITAILVFGELKNSDTSSMLSILFFLLMLVLLMVLYFGTFRLMKYHREQQQMQMVALKNQMLEQSMNETEQTFQLWKTSLHDYKHRIANLKVLADQGDLEAIRNFLEQENTLLSQKLFYYKTGNDTVDTILSMKQHIAENKGITFMIHASVPPDCRVASVHFASMLGNLLDNAIEASTAETEPYIEVKIGQIKEQLVISITNRCTAPVILQTTKQDKALHGIGLHSVRQTVHSYQGEFTTEQDADVFHAKVMIPLSE